MPGQSQQTRTEHTAIYEIYHDCQHFLLSTVTRASPLSQLQATKKRWEIEAVQARRTYIIVEVIYGKPFCAKTAINMKTFLQESVIIRTRKEGVPMSDSSLTCINSVIAYIEDHLNGNLDLGTVAAAVHYSKYHLHRVFSETVGMTLHDYANRRQLTEAAKLLVFSNKQIIEIAAICGYESQQSFTNAFKAMYKATPAQYRDSGCFYPLQLRFTLQRKQSAEEYNLQQIQPAVFSDIPAWMDLMRLVIDGYPVMDETEYLEKLKESILEKRALVLKDNTVLIGALAFTRSPGSIEFLGIHPQYRNLGIQKLFLNALLQIYLPGQDISTTTYRKGDKADTGYRDMLLELGFSERELLTEYGYPTQRFVYQDRYREERDHA